jgi:hypothetical protein
MATESRWVPYPEPTYDEQDYRRGDGWQLFYDTRVSTPRWVVTNPTGHVPPPSDNYNPALGPEDVEQAQGWADKAIADYLERRKAGGPHRPPAGT